MPWQGYLRQDGRKGIRNYVLVVYLVECAHHVAREISRRSGNEAVQVIGFAGCYPNTYADRIMNALCVHPNTGAVLLVSLGCESFNRKGLEENIRSSGRPVHTIVIQEAGGTRKAIEEGTAWIATAVQRIATVPVTTMYTRELIVGTVCGGSDATSGMTANPAVGHAFNKLVEEKAIAIFEETGEMIGLEDIISRRATTPALGIELRKSVEKAARYYTLMGHGSFAPGNADGGLTTIEEKSMGAYCKSGDAPISGLIKPGDQPTRPGLYLMDVVPDGDPKFGFPNINDTVEIVEMIASGCHMILFTTGRGSVVGSAISPVIKICANPDTYLRMQEDMDINAGKILSGTATIGETGNEIFTTILNVAAGKATCSEQLGHQEFILTYKTFTPIGPGCLPA
jgi:altronate dehydratase large subunit